MSETGTIVKAALPKLAAMGYFAAMGLFVPTLAMLIAVLPASAAAAAQAAGPARASARATVGGRVINDAARIGAQLSPPAAHMIARRTTVSAADGTLVPALVYDFE